MTITRLSVSTIDEGNLGKAVISCLRTEPLSSSCSLFLGPPLIPISCSATRLSHVPIMDFPFSRDFHRAGGQLGAISQDRIVNKRRYEHEDTLIRLRLASLSWLIYPKVSIDLWSDRCFSRKMIIIVGRTVYVFEIFISWPIKYTFNRLPFNDILATLLSFFISWHINDEKSYKSRLCTDWILKRNISFDKFMKLKM